MGTLVGVLVGVAVGFAVGEMVGRLVGAFVGVFVGAAVGAKVGMVDGLAVGLAVGGLEGGLNVGRFVGRAVGSSVLRGAVGEVVAVGGAIRLMVPGSVFCASKRISVSFKTSDKILMIVNWEEVSWSLLLPGLQTCPQAFPPAILASPFGPSWSRNDG